MPILKEKPTLADFQQYVRELEVERGFTNNSVLQTCLQMGEELGELFKAVRKAEKMKVDAASETMHIDEEMADVIIFLCSLANRYNIDLEQAFRTKEEHNKTRTWK